MILVTGATGHIGNVLIRELVGRGEQVRALVLPGEPCDSLSGLPIEMVVGNILDPGTLDRWMRGVRLVYHLAGIISIMPGDGELMSRVNVEGARNVARAALKAKVKRMVHTASVHAFRREPHGVVMDERTPPSLDGSAGAYDRTKAEGVQAVLKVVEEGLDAVIVCPSGIIGPHDYLGSEMGQLVKTFATSPIPFIIDGAYDFVDVRDVVQGMILAAEKGRSGEKYILSGEQISLRGLLKTTQQITGIRTPSVAVPIRMALFFSRYTQHLYRWFRKTPQFTTYSLKTVVDNSRFSRRKAEEELGYSPRPLEESIRDYLAWRSEYYQSYYGQKPSRAKSRSWKASKAEN